MNRNNLLTAVLIIALLMGCIALIPARSVRAQGPSIRAILFYSPSCPHCHQVINEDLPPLFDKYGDQLTIIGINVATQQGQTLYQSAVSAFSIPENRIGVPCLIVGDTVLVGSLEIPQQFPEIIEQGLTSGGIDWPKVPGLQAVLESENTEESTNEDPIEQQENPSQNPPVEQDNEAVSDEAEEILRGPKTTIWQNIARDPAGNTISIVVLFGMITSVIGVGVATVRTARSPLSAENLWPSWIIPLISAIGLMIAIYLTYVEFTLMEAVCGPIGDCNTVQQSHYARLFGILPIAILGSAGYLAILISWGIAKFGPRKFEKAAWLSLWIFAWIGTLFSIYLTFLEPFVIGATCMWCVSSAVIMTLLLVVSTAPAITYLRT